MFHGVHFNKDTLVATPILAFLHRTGDHTSLSHPSPALCGLAYAACCVSCLRSSAARRSCSSISLVTHVRQQALVPAANHRNCHLHGFPRVVEPIRAQRFIQLRADVHPAGNRLLTIRPQPRRPRSTCDSDGACQGACDEIELRCEAGVDRKGSRDVCVHDTQLRFQLVVHDEDGEVRPLRLALCFRQGQQLALHISLQLRDGVPIQVSTRDQRCPPLGTWKTLTAAFCASHRPRPGKNVASTSRHRVTGTDHYQSTPAKEDLARLRTSASQLKGIRKSVGAYWAYGNRQAAAQRGLIITYSHCVRMTSLPICSAVVPGKDS